VERVNNVFFLLNTKKRNKRIKETKQLKRKIKGALNFYSSCV